MVYKITATEISIFVLEGIVMAFLFSLIILFIARINKELKGAFYHLVLAVFISDFMFTVFHTPMFLLFPRYGLFTDFYKQNQWLGSYAYTSTTVYTVVQYVGQTLIAFNRFTSIWLPSPLHNKIWNSKWYIFVVIFLPIAFVSHRFTTEGLYSFKDDGNLEVGYVDKTFEKYVLYLGTIMYGTNTGLSALFSFLTIIQYIRLRYTVSMMPTETSIQLIIYSLILFGIQFVRLAYGQIRSFFVTNYLIISIIETSLQYIVVVHAIIASVAIILLSSTTRKTYYKFYCSNIVEWLKNMGQTRKTYSNSIGTTTNTVTLF